MSDNVKLNVTPGADGSLSFDGLKVSVSTSPASLDKESILVKPVQNAIGGMSVVITDEPQIAAASKRHQR